jgi:hypothetical protein
VLPWCELFGRALPPELIWVKVLQFNPSEDRLVAKSSPATRVNDGAARDGIVRCDSFLIAFARDRGDAGFRRVRVAEALRKTQLGGVFSRNDHVGDCASDFGIRRIGHAAAWRHSAVPMNGERHHGIQTSSHAGHRGSAVADLRLTTYSRPRTFGDRGPRAMNFPFDDAQVGKLASGFASFARSGSSGRRFRIGQFARACGSGFPTPSRTGDGICLSTALLSTSLDASRTGCVPTRRRCARPPTCGGVEE